jgi:hypothetical protein
MNSSIEEVRNQSMVKMILFLMCFAMVPYSRTVDRSTARTVAKLSNLKSYILLFETVK